MNLIEEGNDVVVGVNNVVVGVNNVVAISALVVTIFFFKTKSIIARWWAGRVISTPPTLKPRREICGRERIALGWIRVYLARP
jgi:hypothetical protein